MDSVHKQLPDLPHRIIHHRIASLAPSTQFASSLCSIPTPPPLSISCDQPTHARRIVQTFSIHASVPFAFDPSFSLYRRRRDLGSEGSCGGRMRGERADHVRWRSRSLLFVRSGQILQRECVCLLAVFRACACIAFHRRLIDPQRIPCLLSFCVLFSLRCCVFAFVRIDSLPFALFAAAALAASQTHAHTHTLIHSHSHTQQSKRNDFSTNILGHRSKHTSASAGDKS